MFDPFNEYLSKTGGLRIDSSFKKQVLDLVIKVLAICHKDKSKWNEFNFSTADSTSTKKLYVKYVFIAGLYLTLKSRVMEHDTGFLFEISIGSLLKCFSHLKLCVSSLAKYIALVKSVGKDLGYNFGSSEDKMRLFWTICQKMIDSVIIDAKFPFITKDKDKIAKKVFKSIGKFVKLH